MKIFSVDKYTLPANQAVPLVTVASSDGRITVHAPFPQKSDTVRVYFLYIKRNSKIINFEFSLGNPKQKLFKRNKLNEII